MYVISTEISGFQYYLNIDDHNVITYYGLINNAKTYGKFDDAINAIDQVSTPFFLIIIPLHDDHLEAIGDRRSLGDRLRELREERRWVQRYVAEKLGLETSTYQHYEYGRSCPSLDMLPVLAGIYGITIEELVKGKKVLAKAC